ncbi:H-NS histone family protein [Cupriavidus necator]|uniref:DNA-binding protein H-NS-like C-terminal domain-containing protein n=2 Tax=Cupriavidus necator TaxID=106590 RepID=A0A367PH80_CUPNE|nr:H-NS histone family protein [Cupriavidus necator]RCJ07231.1 hypothetical protein DDK22_17640 [Cupriavidus necator]
MRSTQSLHGEAFRRPERSTASGLPNLDHLFVPERPKSDGRGETILWIRTQMARNGISLEDLVKAGCFSEGSAELKVAYRSADGQTWDGRGELPDWLQRAVNAGQSIQHFRVA